VPLDQVILPWALPGDTLSNPDLPSSVMNTLAGLYTYQNIEAQLLMLISVPAVEMGYPSSPTPDGPALPFPDKWTLISPLMRIRLITITAGTTLESREICWQGWPSGLVKIHPSPVTWRQPWWS